MIQSNSSDNYVHRYNIEILNLFETELQVINTKPMIKNKLKECKQECKTLKIRLSLFKIVVNYLLSPFFSAIFNLSEIIFLLFFFVSLYIIMYILNIASAIKKMSANEIRLYL